MSGWNNKLNLLGYYLFKRCATGEGVPEPELEKRLQQYNKQMQKQLSLPEFV